MRGLAVFAVAAITSGFAGGADAAEHGEAPILVELFTSQGCSSCPPADEELARLAEQDGLIAITEHVDYWDYLGWVDEMSLPENADRQRAYATTMGERMIYTPQMVIQGSEHTVGSQRESIEEAIRRQRKNPAVAHVDLSLDGETIHAEIVPMAEGAKKAVILMASLVDTEAVKIEGGENRGISVVYHNVVTGWTELGTWTGDAAELCIPAPENADGVVVIVQNADGGEIFAAAQVALP